MEKNAKHKQRKKRTKREFFSYYQKNIYTLSGFIIGSLGYFPLFRSIRLLMYLFSVVTMCLVMTGKKSRFNTLLFLFILVLIFIFASTFMTTGMYMLSASDAPPRIEYPEFSLDSFNYNFTMNSIDNFFTPIFFFLLVGIPAIAIAGAVWAIIVGQISEGIKTILKIFFVILFTGTAILILNNVGVKVVGLTDAILAVANTYINSINAIYLWLTMFSSGYDSSNSDDPTSFWYYFTGQDQQDKKHNQPEAGETYTDQATGNEVVAGDLNGDGQLGPIEEFFYNLDLGSNYFADALATNPQQFQVGIISSLPLITSFINLLFFFIFLSPKARKWTEEFFDKQKFDLDEEEKEYHLFEFNYKIVSFAILIVFGAFMMFLNYVKIYRETGQFEITQFGYLSIYVSMIIMSIIFLSMPNVTIYTRSSFKNTFIGTIIGLGIMFFGLQFIVGSSYTLSAFTYEYEEYITYRILNTIIFVVPAESFFFHIFIPSFFVGWIYRRAVRNVEKGNEKKNKSKKEKTEIELKKLQLMQTAYMKGTEELMEVVREIDEREKELTKTNRPIKLRKNFMFEDFNSYFLFCIMIFGVNIGFSMTHWVLSDLDPIIFWLCGLGFVYLVAGVIISFIAWKYGWLAGILVHILNNILSIVMTMIYVGGSLV